MHFSQTSPSFNVISISYQCCDSTFIGKCSVAKEKLTATEKAILSVKNITEALVLSTCNRVEIYYVAVGSCDENDLLQAFSKSISDNNDIEEFSKLACRKTGIDAISHIFEVASGLKSQMTGETEILGQVKATYNRAFEANNCKSIINTIFQKANQCAKWIRTNTEIGHGKITLGSVSSELADRIFEDITKAKILLLGSGEVGKSVADALYIREATNITVSSRTFANAQTLAESINAKVIKFEDVVNVLSNFDIVICASFSQDAIIDKPTITSCIKKRNNKPMFLIDLAIPHNIKKDVDTIDDVYLYNLEDLSKIANENISLRKSEIDKAKESIEQKAQIVGSKLGF